MHPLHELTAAARIAFETMLWVDKHSPNDARMVAEAHSEFYTKGKELEAFKAQQNEQRNQI